MVCIVSYVSPTNMSKVLSDLAQCDIHAFLLALVFIEFPSWLSKFTVSVLIAESYHREWTGFFLTQAHLNIFQESSWNIFFTYHTTLVSTFMTFIFICQIFVPEHWCILCGIINICLLICVLYCILLCNLKSSELFIKIILLIIIIIIIIFYYY